MWNRRSFSTVLLCFVVTTATAQEPADNIEHQPSDAQASSDATHCDSSSAAQRRPREPADIGEVKIRDIFCLNGPAASLGIASGLAGGLPLTVGILGGAGAFFALSAFPSPLDALFVAPWGSLFGGILVGGASFVVLALLTALPMVPWRLLRGDPVERAFINTTLVALSAVGAAVPGVLLGFMLGHALQVPLWLGTFVGAAFYAEASGLDADVIAPDVASLVTFGSYVFFIAAAPIAASTGVSFYVASALEVPIEVEGALME